MSNRITMSTLSATALAAALLTGCATVQENPNYQYSTKYKGASPYGTQATQTASNITTVTTQPVTYVQTTPTQQAYNPVQNASYQQTTASQQYTTQASGGTYTQLDHRCLKQETNRQLIGGAVGGTVGAVLGKKVIGGTKGTVAGAVLGGAAGFGIGDKSINCDPVQVQIPQQSAVVSPAYYPAQTVQPVQQPQVVYAATQPMTAPTDAAMPSDIASGYGTPGYQAMMNAQADDINALEPTPMAPAVSAPSVVDVRSDTTGRYSGGYGMNTIVSNQHQVKEGDTVYSLSRKLCRSIDDIKQMNSLSADFNIKLGDTIKLPASRC